MRHSDKWKTTSLLLEVSQHARLHDLAARRGTTFSALLRELLHAGANRLERELDRLNTATEGANHG